MKRNINWKVSNNILTVHYKHHHHHNKHTTTTITKDNKNKSKTIFTSNNNYNRVNDKDIQKVSSISDEQWTVITALIGICLVIGMTLSFILMESKIFNL